MRLGPKYKIAKRLGAGVFDKTQNQKFLLSEARSSKSRGRGRGRFSSKSEFSRQLLEKQKTRFSYYVSEKQFRTYAKSATHSGINPAEYLYQALETRLDNVVYRLGLAPTRQAARQYVSHGHITVNGRKVTIPSFKVYEGYGIAIRPGSKDSPIFTSYLERSKDYTVPSWLSFNSEKMEGEVVSLPKYERAEHHFDLAPVLEYYSR